MPRYDLSGGRGQRGRCLGLMSRKGRESTLPCDLSHDA